MPGFTQFFKDVEQVLGSYFNEGSERREIQWRVCGDHLHAVSQAEDLVQQANA